MNHAAPAISATCRSRPRNEAMPLRPPNRPLPERRPNKPAPRRPPISREPKPPERGDGAFVAAGLARCAAEGAPGWVIDRSIGAADFGSVAVGGAASKVRSPRLPKLLPPPARASAASTANASAAVSASEKMLKRKIDIDGKTSCVREGCIWGRSDCHVNGVGRCGTRLILAHRSLCRARKDIENHRQRLDH